MTTFLQRLVRTQMHYELEGREIIWKIWKSQRVGGIQSPAKCQ